MKKNQQDSQFSRGQTPPEPQAPGAPDSAPYPDFPSEPRSQTQHQPGQNQGEQPTRMSQDSRSERRPQSDRRPQRPVDYQGQGIPLSQVSPIVRQVAADEIRQEDPRRFGFFHRQPQAEPRPEPTPEEMRRRVDRPLGTPRHVQLEPEPKPSLWKRKGVRVAALSALVVLVALMIVFFTTLLPRLREELEKPTPENSPIHYADLIAFYAEPNGLDPFLVAAVIRTESDFRPEVVSHQGAIGLMQILPDTGVWLGQRLGLQIEAEDLYDPVMNIRLGESMLRYLIDHFSGEVEVALAAYNGGQGNVAKWLEDPEYSDDGRTLKAIPFAETRNYVERVMTRRDRFVEAYEGQFPGHAEDAFDSEEEAEANINRGS